MSIAAADTADAAPVFEPLGEDAVLLRLGDGIDLAVNRRVHALAAAIAARRPAWLREIVPAYATLALQVDLAALPDGDPLEHVRAWFAAQAFDAALPVAAEADDVIEVPVRYGGHHGPDLDAVAAHVGMSAADVVARHTAGDYYVAMLGFAPGFPYLLGLDPVLAVPRLQTPRTRVAACSVGIGGAQTGIYPREGPGGWRLIGRTPLTLFEAARNPPSLLLPGRRVRFVAIDDAAFERLASPRPRGGRA